jgi:hypothetical protein
MSHLPKKLAELKVPTQGAELDDSTIFSPGVDTPGHHLSAIKKVGRKVSGEEAPSATTLTLSHVTCAGSGGSWKPTRTQFKERGSNKTRHKRQMRMNPV